MNSYYFSAAPPLKHRTQVVHQTGTGDKPNGNPTNHLEHPHTKGDLSVGERRQVQRERQLELLQEMKRARMVRVKQATENENSQSRLKKNKVGSNSRSTGSTLTRAPPSDTGNRDPVLNNSLVSSRIAYVVYSPQGNKPLENLGIHRTSWRGSAPPLSQPHRNSSSSLAAAVASPNFHHSSGVRCEYDRETKSQLLFIPGGVTVSFLKPTDNYNKGQPHTRPTAHRREVLPSSSPQSVVVLQLCVAGASSVSSSSTADLTVEISVSGVGSTCHLLFSSVVKTVQVCSHHVKLPLHCVRRGEWVNLFFDVETLHRTYAQSGCTASTPLRPASHTVRVLDVKVSGGEVVVRRVLAMAALPSFSLDPDMNELNYYLFTPSSSPSQMALPESLKLPVELGPIPCLFIRDGQEKLLSAAPPSEEGKEERGAQEPSPASVAGMSRSPSTADSTPRPSPESEWDYVPVSPLTESDGVWEEPHHVPSKKKLPKSIEPLSPPPPLPSKRTLVGERTASKRVVEKPRSLAPPEPARVPELEPFPSSVSSLDSSRSSSKKEEEQFVIQQARPSSFTTPLRTASRHRRGVSPSPIVDTAKEMVQVMDERVRRIEALLREPSPTARPRPSSTPSNQRLAMLLQRSPQLRAASANRAQVPTTVSVPPALEDKAVQTEPPPAFSVSSMQVPPAPAPALPSHVPLPIPKDVSVTDPSLMVRPLSLNLNSKRNPSQPPPPPRPPHTPSHTPDALDVWCSTEEPIQWTLMRPATRRSEPSEEMPTTGNANVVNRLCFDSSMLGSDTPCETVVATPDEQTALKDRAAELLHRLRTLREVPTFFSERPVPTTASSWTFRSDPVRGEEEEAVDPLCDVPSEGPEEDVVQMEDPLGKTTASTRVPTAGPHLERQGTPLPWPTALRAAGRLGPHANHYPHPPTTTDQERTTTSDAEDDGVSIYSCKFQTILPSHPSTAAPRYPPDSTSETEDGSFSLHRGSVDGNKNNKNNERYVYDPVLRCFLDREENAFLEELDA